MYKNFVGAGHRRPMAGAEHRANAKSLGAGHRRLMGHLDVDHSGGAAGPPALGHAASPADSALPRALGWLLRGVWPLLTRR